MRFHHIGYLIKDMEKAIKEFERLGFEKEGTVKYDCLRKVNLCFLNMRGGVKVELVSPAEKDSVVYDLIKRYRNMPYHLCYVCKDLDGNLKKLCREGYVQIDEPCAAPLLENKRVVLLMSPDIGMLELLEG